MREGHDLRRVYGCLQVYVPLYRPFVLPMSSCDLDLVVAHGGWRGRDVVSLTASPLPPRCAVQPAMPVSSSGRTRSPSATA